MAIRVTLPGRGAIDFDVETARILQVGTLDAADAQDYVDAGNPDIDTAEKVIDGTAVPKGYVDLGDIRRWDAATTYAAQEYVIYEGRLYFANMTTTGDTPVPRPSEIPQWAELERSDFFLQVTGDNGVMLTADGHEHNVNVLGGTGINTVADAATDTLRIDLDAAIGNLSDVDTTTNMPTTNQILQFNADNMWVPVDNPAGGYTNASADTNDDVEATATRNTLNITGGDSSNPVNTTITSTDTATNIEISVEEATSGAGGHPGLISIVEKGLLEAFAMNGYNNRRLRLTSDGNNLVISDDEINQEVTRLDISALIQEHGGRLWDSSISYSAGDIISIVVDNNYRQYIATQANTNMNPTTEGTPWQEASILRLRDIANIEISADPENNELLTWSTTEDGWVVTDAATVVGMVTDLIREGDFTIEDERATRVNIFDATANRNVNYPLGERSTFRGSWLEADNVTYQQFDVVYEPNTNKLYELQSDGVPTEFMNTNPAEARRTTTGTPLVTVWELLGTDWQGTWSSLVAYDEGSIVSRVDGDGDTHLYLKLTNGQTDGAGTDPLAVSSTAWRLITVDSDSTYELLTTQPNPGDDVVVTLQEAGGTNTRLILDAGDNVTLTRTGDATSSTILIDSPDTNTEYNFTTGLTITEDTVNDPPGPDTISVTNPFTAEDEAKLDTLDPDLPLALWSGTRGYIAGDQVIHDGGSNVNSIYIANKDIAAPAEGADPNAEPQTRDGQPDWYLSRSGIVSVQGPADAGPAGLTVNDTLRLYAGGGINIIRSGANFTISQQGHGHSDPDNFVEGFVYSFTDISVANTGYHHGTVGSIVGSFEITSARLTVRSDGTEPVELIGRPVGGTVAQGIYGFVTDADDRGDITPNRADENSIIYVSVEATAGPGDVLTALVLQADPSFTSQGNIANVINLQGNVDANRQINRGLMTARTVGLRGLIDDGTAGTVAPWALDGNPDQIDSNKFEGLSTQPPPTWADGDAFATMDTRWLPTISPKTYDPTDTNAARDRDGYLEYSVNNRVIDFSIPDIPREISELDNVTLTPTTTDVENQVLRYDDTTDPANPVWVNADLPTSASGRIVFNGDMDPDNITGATATATHFIRNVATPEASTIIRSTEITGGELIFNLLQDNELDSTFRFTRSPGTAPVATLNWDVVAGGQSDTVVVTEDTVNTRHYDSLREEAVAARGTFTFNPAAGGRARGGNWTVTYFTTPRAPAQANSLAGGEFPATLFEAYDSTGGVTTTATASGMRVVWNTAGMNNGGRTFGAARSFLQSFPGYTWTVSSRNVNLDSSCTINWATSTFPNGLVSYQGAGDPEGTPVPTTDTTLDIGGLGNVTFSAGDTIWNNDSLGQDSINATFTRPAAVTGAAQDQVLNNQFTNRTGNPTFQYPVFWFTNPSNLIADITVADFTGGNTTQATLTSKTRTIGNLSGIDFTNNTGSTQYIWVAYPTGSPDITRVDVRTRQGNADATITGTLSDFQRSSTDLTFQPTGGPASAAEDYKWFWIEVTDNSRVTLGNTS